MAPKMEQADALASKLIAAYETSGETKALITISAIDGIARTLGCTMMPRDMYMVIYYMEERGYVFTHLEGTKVYALASKVNLFEDAKAIHFEADDDWEFSGRSTRPAKAEEPGDPDAFLTPE